MTAAAVAFPPQTESPRKSFLPLFLLSLSPSFRESVFGAWFARGSAGRSVARGEGEEEEECVPLFGLSLRRRRGEGGKLRFELTVRIGRGYGCGFLTSLCGEACCVVIAYFSKSRIRAKRWLSSIFYVESLAFKVQKKLP